MNSKSLVPQLCEQILELFAQSELQTRTDCRYAYDIKEIKILDFSHALDVSKKASVIQRHLLFKGCAYLSRIRTLLHRIDTEQNPNLLIWVKSVSNDYHKMKDCCLFMLCRYCSFNLEQYFTVPVPADPKPQSGELVFMP